MNRIPFFLSGIVVTIALTRLGGSIGRLYAWDLAGAAHPNLAAVKVDGATKEFSFFGGRGTGLRQPVDAAVSSDDVLAVRTRPEQFEEIARPQHLFLQKRLGHRLELDVFLFEELPGAETPVQCRPPSVV